MPENAYLEIFRAIKERDNFLLVTHISPDGDAASSICAMIELLESLGKNYQAFCADQMPERLSFLPHTEKITHNADDLDLTSYQAIISLDCGSIARTGLAEYIEARPKGQFFMEIDHHIKHEDKSDLELRVSEASATTEVLYYFFKKNQIKINSNIATCILTGIATDTGNFIYPSTSQTTIDIASEMILRGARLPNIIKKTCYNSSLASMKIWGAALSRLKVNRKYNLAYTVLTRQDFVEAGADEEMIEDLAGFISCLHSVKAVLLLKESSDGRIKGSWRCNNDLINVADLARLFGGGGHAKAAGFSLPGSLKESENGWQAV